MTREINNIVIHCTATPQTTTVTAIMNYWKYSLGWLNPGYHFIVAPEGTLINLHPISKVANGVRGHNQDSIHISYIGGVDADSKPVDNRTEAQKTTMEAIVRALSEIYPNAKIRGHRDFEGVNKACPSFDVQEWIESLNN